MRYHLTVIGAAAGAVGLVLSFVQAAQSDVGLSVSIYTGVWGDAQKECIVGPFEKEAGVKVITNEAPSAVTYVTIRQQRNDPQIDVAWIDGGDPERAWSEGLLDAIDPRDVPNLANISDRAIYRSDGEIYSVGAGYYAAAILWNTDEIENEPDSWWDLWSPQYANRVVLPGPEQAIFTPFFLQINKMLGGDNENLTPGMEKFRALEPYAYYGSTGAVQGAIQSGEVVLGTFYTSSAWAMADQGLPIASVTPKDGAGPAADIRMALVRGSKNKALALKFINYALGTDPLTCMSEKLYVGPPLKSPPQLSEKAKKRMPWGPSGTVDDLSIPDWNEILRMRPIVSEQWNRNVVR